MKVLVLTEYPPSAAGLATQGQLLCRGLREIGVDVHPVHFESPQEKEWYYRWFQPDVVVGIGFWGHLPHLVLHPQQFGMKCVPWLLADGYVAAHQEVLNALPLILVTSNWVKETYIRDGIRGDNIEVLPVGCDTDCFRPRNREDLKVRSIREAHFRRRRHRERAVGCRREPGRVARAGRGRRCRQAPCRLRGRGCTGNFPSSRDGLEFGERCC